MTSAKHILVVDDDPDICELVAGILMRENYAVSRAWNVAGARQQLGTTDVDLIILDLMLPDQDGLSFCRALRGEAVATPIIMLTAKGDDFDRVLGLEMGADDYLAKPFHSRELLARIRAVLRRSAGALQPANEPSGRFIRFEGWTLDTAKRELVSASDVVVFLSGAEYELLLAFLTWPQVTLSREKLLDATRGRSAAISDRSIDIQVSRLRRKLGDDPKTPRIIRTIWGDGYLFTPDIAR
ncbi:response regulator [Rhodobacteraceae bacterium 2CG4]|uniref:Regulatory protein VirG n=1 Tax=Halovulum marinum TaxID=2662447 RepID=A0A6L5Z179_9RHOB|nr:response regulator [Halovulum marinum]MSU90258.1 response regulator [Halovulum marinum]